VRAYAKASLRVAVAGGSIGGLCTGIALRAIGCDVNIFERTTGPMTSRGAGIVVQPDLLALMQAHGAPRLPITTCTHRQYSEPSKRRTNCAARVARRGGRILQRTFVR
jgi:2-polyprenyl-6-methoxyphenol hydroxylase-like FAD-dependent oxidoreductase